VSPYATDAAFRTALEQRLLNLARATSVNLDRLRRQVVLERLLARLDAAQPGAWVLKGAMALEVRLGTAARATMDVDLGLRDPELELDSLADRIAAALTFPSGDRFVLRLVDVERFAAGGVGGLARARVECRLAGREFGRIQVDVAQRSQELTDTERVRLHGHLTFAGIDPPEVEVVSVARHVAEKFHAMLLTFEDRENTRVRDLVDLVILREHGLVDPARAAAAIATVFRERTTAVPAVVPPFPSAWPDRYERIAGEHGVAASTFADAIAIIQSLWGEMFPPTEKDS
jgi:predicted nucleotidyltransferase component of viral defense system